MGGRQGAQANTNSVDERSRSPGAKPAGCQGTSGGAPAAGGVWRPPARIVPEPAAAAAAEEEEAPEEGSAGTLRRATRLLIIRHGETLWNKEKRMQGQLDIALNDEGFRQAERAAEALRQLGVAEKVDAVVSSDLSRASQTADAISAVCPSASRHTDADLREIHFGVMQGRLVDDDEVSSSRAQLVAAWRRGDFSKAVEGGESLEALIARGMRGLRSASSRGPARRGGLVVVVAHGGLIKWCGLRIALGDEAPSSRSLSRPDLQQLMDMPVRNCCISSVLYDHKTDIFQSEGWFQTLEGNSRARDDSG